MNTNERELPPLPIITLRSVGWLLLLAGLAWLLYLGFGLFVSYMEWFPSSDISLAIGIWLSFFTGPFALLAVVIGSLLLLADRRMKRSRNRAEEK
jgi:hypothetical protein